jgi:sterol 3beta-glucosyltransferase
MQDAGHVVLVTCNAENVAFFGSMGVEARAVHFDMMEFLRESPKLRKAMATGNAETMNMGIANKVTETYEESFDAIWEVAQQFRPDVLMPGLAFDLYTAHAIGQVLEIPVVYCPLSPQATLIPSAEMATDMNEPFWHFQAGLLGLKALQVMIFRKFARVARKKLAGKLQGAPLFADEFKHMVGEMVRPSAPVLLQLSESLGGLPSDLPKVYLDRLRPTGFWVVSRELQAASAAGDEHFGGGRHAQIDDFLRDSSEPPVYMGWGSMVATSPQHMADLAVRALMISGRRGIVLGGLAKLHAGLLTDQALVDYAGHSVLFVDSAPHEALFPRCSAVVHHGGMGTTAAGLRSGRPSIVTPVIFDQFDNARMVQASGAGVGMPAFRRVTAQSLAAAISLATADKAMLARAHELGEALRGEDGLGSAVAALDAFVAEELDTGRWRAAFDEALKRRREPPEGRLRWFLKMRGPTPFE